MTNEIKQFKDKEDKSLYCLFDEDNEIPHYFNTEKNAIKYKSKHKIKGFIFKEGRN